jgi:ribosomal protein L37E
MRQFFEPKYVRELANAQRLVAVCEPCGRRALLSPRALERRFGELVTLNDIRARVRCTRCGKRTKAVRVEVEDRLR